MLESTTASPSTRAFRPKTALLAALVVALFYVVFTTAALVRHQDPLWFVWIGERIATGDAQDPLGYDGQFVYFIARDGWEAEPRLDIPAYRLQRILLPLIARVAALGNPDWIPWATILVNLVAITGATLVLGRWLEKRGASPWLSLGYGLYVGTFLAYSRALNEPLAFGLALVAIVLWFDARWWPAVALFALAALAKEQTLALPFGLGIAALFDRAWPRAGRLLLAIVPVLLWDLFLWQRFGTFPVGAGSSVQPVPLVGILSQLSAEPGRLSGLLFVALPALVLAGVAAWLLWRDRTSAVGWMLLVNAALVILLPTDVYDHIMHAGRNATGVVVAAMFALPLLARGLRWLLVAWWVAPTAVWLAPVLRWAPWR